MKKKRILLILFIIIAIMCTNIAMVFGTTKSELEQENKDLQEKIKNAKGELSQIEEELDATMSQIQRLTVEISEYQYEIGQLDRELDGVEKSISDTQERLEEAERKYEKQDEMFQNRIVALYEAGETSYLDVLLSSSGVADFISNYYLIAEIATYDTELLDQMDKNKNEIRSIKDQLEEAKSQIETIKNTKAATQKALKDSQDVKEQYAEQLNEEEEAKKAEIEQFEKDKQDVANRLAALSASNNYPEYIPGNPSASGYIFPVAGLSIYNINNRNYPSYAGHTGVDVNINVVGKSVVAVKSGKVVISEAMRNSNGTYRSYGEYVVIDHNDGTMTLYAHGLANTRRVSVGDYVEQGQVLMTVGSTGNSTGTHLHFEVRVGGRCVNPIPYLQ